MSSVVDVSCPNCDKTLKVSPAFFGKRVKCKSCEHAFVVQDPAAAPRPPPAPPKRPFDDDDEGPDKIEVISEGDDIPRCPHCAKELDPPDAIVCIHCGFNNRTREKAETKKVWAPTFEDWAMHL